MVLVDTEVVGMPMLETIERLAALGVGVTHSGGKIRMVTHLDVDDTGVAVALDSWRELASERTLMALFSKNYPPRSPRASRRDSGW